jgi:hypothetical protein
MDHSLWNEGLYSYVIFYHAYEKSIFFKQYFLYIFRKLITPVPKFIWKKNSHIYFLISIKSRLKFFNYISFFINIFNYCVQQNNLLKNKQKRINIQN